MAAPSKLLKFVSNQADTWTPTGSHLVDVDMQAGVDFSNLNDAVLMLSTVITTSESVPGPVVRPVSIGIGRDAPEYDSDCFIRNCWMESEVAGRFDDMDEPNFLNQNLDFYSKSTEGRKAATSYNGSFLQDEYGFLRSTFRDLQKLTTRGQTLTTASSALTATLPITLGKIIPFANNNRFYPNRLMGKTTLHLEFENDAKPLVYSYLDPSVHMCQTIGALAADARNELYLSQRYYDPRAYNGYMNQPIEIQYTSYFGDVGGVTGVTYYTTPSDLSGVTPGVYPIPPASVTGSAAGTGLGITVTVGAPTPVGLQVLTVAVTAPGADYGIDEILQVSGTLWGAAADHDLFLMIQTLNSVATHETHETYISGLAHDIGTDRVRVTLASPLPPSVTPFYGDVRFQMLAETAEPTWAIEKVQLTVPQLFPAKNEIASFLNNIKESGLEIPWMTWMREPQQMNAGLRFDRQFTLPPNTGNVICLTSVDSLVSVQDECRNFRFRINGQDATMYDIAPEGSLYYDGIVETWNNMGAQLNNLDESRNEDNVFTLKPMIYSTVVPLSPEPGFFTLKIRANNIMTQKEVYAYKQVQRVLKISASEIVIE